MKSTLIALLAFSLNSNGQLTVVDNPSAAQVAELLEGLNVSVLNVAINCPGVAIGHFSGESELSFTEGLVLSTGNVSGLGAPASTFLGGILGTAFDVDLVSISGGMINDACVLEFDCIPFGDTLLFNFSFGSEEYPEYVCAYNDAFGFFINGPGLSGPYTNDAVNIALIPATSMPVTINNVHNGLYNNPLNPNCPAQNPEYYVDNGSGAQVALDGITVAMVAQVVVQEGQTYHIKLAVGDAMDSIYDTALFFEALSFRSTGLSTRIPRHASAMRLINGADGITVLAPADATGAELRVLDASGRIAMSERITGERSFFGTQALAKGVYTAVPVGVNGLKPVRFVKE